jgi:carboxypeptidase PM20D1
VVDRVFPGVSRPCALIGVAEKGSVSIDFSLTSGGGHASTPPPHTTLGTLCRVATDLENKPFPARICPATRQMFDTVGRHSSFFHRMIFANLWCFRPLLDRIAKRSGGDLNALLRTTVAVTRMKGSKAYNVLPPKSSLGVNVRILEGDTMDSVLARMKKLAKDDAITIRAVSGMNPSITSDTASAGYGKVCKAIRATWTDAIISPYLMMACSDSRYYCRITDKVYRFSPMHLSKEERDSIHGHNERIPVETLLKTVEFYARLLPSL